MKKNFLLLPLLTLVSFFLIQCSPQHDISVLENKIPEQNRPSQGGLRSVDIASILSSEDFNIADFSELKELVSQNVQKGYDEKLYLRDLKELACLRSSRTEFPQKFLSAISKANLREASSEGTNGSIDVSDLDMSLYWMNHDQWNKKDRPVIAYVIENVTDPSEIPALITRKDNGKIETIMIDEEYAKNNPTIIVNYSKKPEGTPIPTKQINSMISLPPSFPLEYVKSIYLGKVQAFRQYDPWIDGGSEFYFLIEHPTSGKDEKGQPILTEFHGRYLVTFTRKEIEEKTIKDLDYLVISEWDRNLDKFKLLLYEDDSTFPMGGNFEFSFGYEGFTFSFKVPVPNTRTDIYSVQYTGNFLMSTSNINSSEDYPWRWHNANGIRWTLPIKKGRIFSDDILIPSF